MQTPSTYDYVERTFIKILWNRTLERKPVPNLQLMDVLRSYTIIIFLDQQGQYSGFVWLGHGRVGTDDGFAFGVFEGAGVVFREVFGGTDDEAGRDGEESGLVIGKFEDEATKMRCEYPDGWRR